MWETLEALARQGIQRPLQQVLEDEVEQVLGWRRYKRRDGIDAGLGYRNGYGKPRRLSLSSGAVTVRRPASTPKPPLVTVFHLSMPRCTFLAGPEWRSA